MIGYVINTQKAPRQTVYIVVQHLFSGDVHICTAHRTKEGAEARKNRPDDNPEYGYSIVELTLEN